jgi:hypothetical protein
MQTASLAPPADLPKAGLDDGGSLRRMRRRLVFWVGVFALAVGLPTLLGFGHIQAEWALALGKARIVAATVSGSQPSAEFNRFCSSMTRVDVAWPAPNGNNPGNFTVCDSEASQYPVGRVIQVAVVPGDSSVIVGESRGAAIFGVVIESLTLLFLLLMLAAAVRWWLVLRAAATRWRSSPWLPGQTRDGVRRRGKGQPVLVLFDPEALPWPATDGNQLMDLLVERRRDGERLLSGDPVWVIPTGRSLVHRSRSGPYAVVRAGDWMMFWGTGNPMPRGTW